MSNIININRNKQYRVPYTGCGAIVLKEGYDVEDVLRILLVTNTMYKPEVVEKIVSGKYEIFIEGEIIMKPWKEKEI